MPLVYRISMGWISHGKHLKVFDHIDILYAIRNVKRRLSILKKLVEYQTMAIF